MSACSTTGFSSTQITGSSSDRGFSYVLSTSSILSMYSASNFPTHHILPSRPGELHPEPLTEPCVNLSIYTARATEKRLPPSVQHEGSSCFQLTRTKRRSPASFAPRSLQSLQRYYEAVRP